MMGDILLQSTFENVVDINQSTILVSSMQTLVFLLGLSGVAYFFYQRGSKKMRNKAKESNSIDSKKIYDVSSCDVEVCEGELKMDDIIAFFKLKQLNPESDVPVLIQDPSEVFEGHLEPQDMFFKEGYVTIFAGVYNQEKDVLEGSFFTAKSLDDKLKEAIGNDKLVTLS